MYLFTFGQCTVYVSFHIGTVYSMCTFTLGQYIVCILSNVDSVQYVSFHIGKEVWMIFSEIVYVLNVNALVLGTFDGRAF